MLSRRDFVRRVLTLAGLVLVPATAWAKKMAIKLDKVPKLRQVGGWMITEIKGRQVLFVRDAEESVRALSPVCTHKECLVGYNPGTRKIECGCHKSSYDLDGKNLDGPAPKPLKKFSAKLSGDRIIFSLD